MEATIDNGRPAICIADHGESTGNRCCVHILSLETATKLRDQLTAVIETLAPTIRAQAEVPSEKDKELYPKALRVLKQTGRVSTAAIQRRLHIGYFQATRILSMMEDEGIIGPENGSGTVPRRILVDLNTL